MVEPKDTFSMLLNFDSPEKKTHLTLSAIMDVLFSTINLKKKTV